MNHHEVLIGLIGGFLLAAVIIVSTLDKRSEEKQSSLYCEMVAEYKASNGQYGWPAYKGECK